MTSDLLWIVAKKLKPFNFGEGESPVEEIDKNELNKNKSSIIFTENVFLDIL